MAGGLEVWRCAIIRGSTDCEIFPETSCQKNSKPAVRWRTNTI